MADTIIVVDATQPTPVIYETITTPIVKTVATVTSVIDIGVGLPGIVRFTADTALGGNRVVKLTATGCAYADNSIDYNNVLGFTTKAVSMGETATIINSGELSGFTGLLIGMPIYLGTNGVHTQIPAEIGVHQQVGIAKSETVILVQLSQAIFLGAV